MVLNYISHRFMVLVNKLYTSTFNDFKDKVLLFIIYYNVRARARIFIYTGAIASIGLFYIFKIF